MGSVFLTFFITINLPLVKMDNFDKLKKALMSIMRNNNKNEFHLYNENFEKRGMTMEKDFIEVEDSGYFIGANMIFDLDISSNAKLLYLYLTKMGNQQRSSFPSYRTMAKYCGFSKRTAIRVMQELLDAGLILKEARHRGKMQTSNIYIILTKPRNKVNHLEKDNKNNQDEASDIQLDNEPNKESKNELMEKKTSPETVSDCQSSSDTQSLGGVFYSSGGDTQSPGKKSYPQGGDTVTPPVQNGKCLGGATQSLGSDTVALQELIPKEQIKENFNSFNPSIYQFKNIELSRLELTKQIDEQIDYQTLIFDYKDNKLALSVIEQIKQIMLDVYSNTEFYIKVSRKSRCTKDVIMQIQKVNMFHVQYICECMENTNQKISNIPEYLKTALYNAPLTINIYNNKQYPM